MTSFYATVYRLTLGDYDATTGIPALQYSPTTARVVIGAKGSSISFGNMLFYPKTDGVMITNANYNQGDIVVDPSSSTPETLYWRVQARRPVSVGNSLIAYVFDLVQIPCLPFNPNPLSVMGGYDPAYYDENFYAHYYITTP